MIDQIEEAALRDSRGLLDSSGALTFGRRAGDTLAGAAAADPEYLCWLLQERTVEMLALTPGEVEQVRLALAAVAPPVPVSTAVPEVPVELIGVSVDRVDLNDLMETVPAPPLPFMFDIEWTDEQKRTLDAVEDWWLGRGGLEDFFALTGPAGSGKSTLVSEICARHPHAALTAMTGKAAMRLQQCTGAPTSTLHKVMYYPPRGGENVRFVRLREPPSGFVVVDEASMMTPSVFADLKRWGVRALLVGDSYQLPPVITDKHERDLYGDDYSVFSRVDGAALETVMRNAGGVLQAATCVRETGRLLRKSVMSSGEGYEYVAYGEPVKRAVDEYCEDPDDHMLITWRNAVRMNANKMIRARFGHGGPLPDEGEPVLLKKNGQGHLNGEVVICKTFEVGPVIGKLETLYMEIDTGEKLLVSVTGGNPDNGGEFFDGGFWTSNWSKYNSELEKLGLDDPIPVTWGYCHTAHSAQGSESRRSTVFLASGDERSSYFKKPTTLPNGNKATFAARFIYTALTRGKKRATMIVGH